MMNYGQQPYTPENMGLDNDVPLAKTLLTDMQDAVEHAKHYLEIRRQRQKA